MSRQTTLELIKEPRVHDRSPTGLDDLVPQTKQEVQLILHRPVADCVQCCGCGHGILLVSRTLGF
jgi:hypothetical protein